MALTAQQIAMYRQLAATTPGSDPADPNNWRAIDAARILEENGISRNDVTFDPGRTAPPTMESAPELWANDPRVTGGPAVGTPVNAGPDPAVTARNRATFDSIRTILNAAGLQDLYTVDANGVPGGWVWEQLTANKGEAAILIDMEQTQPFQQKFGVITKLREASASNPAIRVPTPGQVLSYREDMAVKLRSAGLPSWFYDSNDDFDNLMVKGISPVEAEEKLGTAWRRVREADPGIRAAFNQFYGLADGDAAMAAFFLDPANTTAKLETASRAAYTAGRGQTLGITVGKDTAEAVAKLALSDQAISAGLAEVSGMSALFNEKISETDDLTTATGVNATLLGSGQDQARLRRRLTERDAINRGTGGAVSTGAGVTGLG